MAPKVGVLDDGAKELIRATEILKKDGKQDKNQEALLAWWTDAEKTAVEDKKFVDEAGLYGGRRALNLTSYVPLTMAAMYLLLILYFKTQGGYKALSIEGGGRKR